MLLAAGGWRWAGKSEHAEYIENASTPDKALEALGQAERARISATSVRPIEAFFERFGDWT